MAKLAVDRFLQFVERSGLIPTDRLTALIDQWKRMATATDLDDAERCGAYLVQAGAITPWQCHKLLDGRHRGFMLDHLGSGGMSNVYLAEHVLMQRRVAIKVLPEHLVADSSYLARFLFEGQAVAALDHPNIVRAYDLGTDGRIHYLVMEYVEGSDLEELVARQGPLPYGLAADYVAQAAVGLEHAHEAGIVHRDIKPANLLVDRAGTVKVLDLGLACFRAEIRPVPEFARDEQVLGTAAYFAPEQAVNSQTVDGRADIYGLGCTLYYLLTGHPPFRGETPLELKQVAPSILVDRPDAPAPLVAICTRMMEKRPEDRFQTACEVVTALGRWLAQERVMTHSSARGQMPNWPPAEGPAISEDTLIDLHDTAKFERRRARSSSHVFAPFEPSLDAAASSDVLAPPPPPLPPLVPPPRRSNSESIAPSLPRAQAVAPRAVPPTPATVSSEAVVPPLVVTARRARRRSSGALWAALIAAALLLGVVLMGLLNAVK
jgi:serine/threonine protein kinase